MRKIEITTLKLNQVVFKIIAVLPVNLQCCYYVIWPNLGLNMCHYPALKVCWTQHQNTEIKTPTAHFQCQAISVVSWKQCNRDYLLLFLGLKVHKEISRGVQRNVTATSQYLTVTVKLLITVTTQTCHYEKKLMSQIN